MVDPITLAVVRGALETAQREMTLTMERTGRSSVLTVSRDFSNAIFNWEPAMIVQGQDLPIHLGSLILATKAVAGYFADDVHPGDVMFHNDPTWDGSHIADWCMYKPVFVDDELLFWAVSKGHMADSGGPAPGSYNPEAREIYAEGLRIPPIKIYEAGRERRDVLNLSSRTRGRRRNQAGDLRAQLGAVNVGALHLQALVEKYGRDEISACIVQLLDLAEQQMRERIGELADGTFEAAGSSRTSATVSATRRSESKSRSAGDSHAVELDSPPQIPFYTNSYRANTTSAVYLGLVMFLQPEPPSTRACTARSRSTTARPARWSTPSSRRRTSRRRHARPRRSPTPCATRSALPTPIAPSPAGGTVPPSTLLGAGSAATSASTST